MDNATFVDGKSSQPSRRREALAGIATFIARRLVFGALVLISITFLSYLGLNMAQGVAFYPRMFFIRALGSSASKTLGYLGRLARGELGLSMAGSVTQVPVTVAEVLPTILAKSFGLLAVVLLAATLVGVVLGILAAGRRRSNWSLMTLLASIVGVSVPSFFAALLLQLAAIRLTQIAGRPILPVGGFGWDKHILMPALVLAARPIAQIARVTFVSVSDVLDQDYVRTAHSKGLPARWVMIVHVIRNAAIPILTTVGLSLRFSLSSLPVIEFFFSWPGLGFTLLKAISRQDDNLTVALVLCLGALFILVNLILEVLYRFIDPRLREPAAHPRRRDRASLARALKSIPVAVRELLTNNPFRQWLSRQKTGDSPSPFATMTRNGEALKAAADRYRTERLRALLRGTASNLPFVAGAILVGGLFVVFLFGPRLAPHSPYTTQGLTFVDGELTLPPFAPGGVHPWGADVLGRDVMSLVLAGAQQTLLLATLVVAARMVVGFVLGALAGWLSGSWVDRFLLGLTVTIAAFPALLLAMTFILALGIRQGFRPFVIALCLVGWGEVMQYVRGEVMTIRPKLFIESAVALGLTTPRIIMSHVLPNLLSALISIAALEMGATLMLLGELGFIGIFIGGGAFAELQWMAPPYHFSDVPEWGALLSNVRRYARAYPWMALYPSLAFFVAILGFNLFGEGMRRMVETVGLGITRLVNRYTVAVILLAAVGVGWVQANTGAMAVYRRQASGFDGQQALGHVAVLTDPSLDGQALGTSGMDVTAFYIAQQFQNLGLQSAGEELGYFQIRKRSFEWLDVVPQLVIEDSGPPLNYRQDFVEYPGSMYNAGQARGRVHFLAPRDLIGRGQWTTIYRALEDLDFSDDVLLLLSESDIDYFRWETCLGFLIVAQDPADLERRYTLSSYWHSRPMLWISEATADRLLEGTGYTVAKLRRVDEELEVDEVFDLPTEITASMEIQGAIQENVPVRHVIGHLPGIAASIEGAPIAETAKLDDQLIIVLAQYDAPPLSPEGAFYPAANDNVSGVAVMLETIRTMQETGYQPYRTFLFVAYSAEGLEGGAPVYPPDVERFLTAKYGFSTNFEIEAVVDLRGLGAGQGDEADVLSGGGTPIVISAGGSMRLAELFEETAGLMGVPVRRGGEAVDISIVFEESSDAGSQEAPHVGLSWDGWEATSRLPADTLQSVSEDRLERAGRVLSLALMILGRELYY